jgi:sulfur carrier protein
MNERELFINGVALQTQAPNLQALLLERGFSLEAAFACAVNNAFVPRPHWPQQPLQPGDRIDVIAPITGG